MVRPYLNEVGGKVENDTSLFTGGINTYVDKAFLESDQLAYAMNLTMASPPGIETRGGRTTIAQHMENNQWASNIGTIIDIWAYNEDQFYVITDQSGSRKLIEVYIPAGASNVNYVVRDLTDEYSLTIENEDNYYFTLARQASNEYLYITGLSFKIKVSIHENPLSTIAQNITDDKYGICCCHKGRLFLGSPGTNRIVFSALYDFDNFAEAIQYQVVTTTADMADIDVIYLMQNSGYDNLWDKYVWNGTQFVQDGTMAKTELVIDVNTGLSIPDYSVIAGEFQVTNSIGKLVSLKSFDDKLMIFCEHSMHCMYGNTPDITMQNQFQLVDLNNNLGALADRCVTIGGGKLFWLGDNEEVYEYTGSAINIISRPGKTRNSTLSIGAVSGLLDARDIHRGGTVFTDLSHSKFVATSEKLYINIWNAKSATAFQKLLLIFDVYNRVWWCEDGEFNTIGNYSDYTNKILLGKSNGDILVTGEGKITSRSEGGVGTTQVDQVYDFDTNKTIDQDIEFEFHTRVYGADGTDLRKTLSDVWFQARADADVYINDMWTSYGDWYVGDGRYTNLVKIGTLNYDVQMELQPRVYRPETYEQQVCYVEKMYGQRLNAFQIIVKGKQTAVFYLMKREWRAR